jgi:hypothetical protein
MGCVDRLPVNIALHEAVGLAEDGEVKHANFVISLFFTCPLAAGVAGVDEVEKGFYVVVVDRG